MDIPVGNYLNAVNQGGKTTHRGRHHFLCLFKSEESKLNMGCIHLFVLSLLSAVVVTGLFKTLPSSSPEVTDFGTWKWELE